MSKPLCGPAFPCMDSSVINKIGLAATLNLPDGADVHERDRVYIQATAQAAQGMSLRDYFAAKCNVEVYVPVDVFYRTYGRNPDASELAKLIAEIRYIEADAMLAARGEP